METTVHLVYPHGPRISCPDAIGRKLADHLRNGYKVIHHEWAGYQVIKPGSNDILLGHPHPTLFTCFRESVKQTGWRRILPMAPYCPGDPKYVAYLEPMLSKCNLFLAITGNHWFASTPTSAFAHWFPKIMHLDLAVDRLDFPVLKSGFNKPGNRRFLYIGHCRWYKNTDYLSEIAQRMPETHISWIGKDDKLIKGVPPLGYQDFATKSAKKLIAAHDFLITVGKADPNPTAILEAMAWGLIPVCTPQSGYVDYPGIVNIPLDDAQRAVTILRQLQEMPEEKLKEMQAVNWEALDNHFNWDRFARQVVEAIESDASPPLKAVTLKRKLMIHWAAMISPSSLLRPRAFYRSLRGHFKQFNEK